MLLLGLVLMPLVSSSKVVQQRDTADVWREISISAFGNVVAVSLSIYLTTLEDCESSPPDQIIQFIFYPN